RDLLSDLQNALEEPTKGTSFVQHLFVAFWQQSQFKICKTNLEENELVMVKDFGENRKAAYAEEVKSAHFGKSQITVHPVVCFYDICHDHHAVKSFTILALNLL
uniref:Uncharacterized protein n=1 Tax=Biomphalaria glabrata TaxID=6526 RepID=A0A2C9LYS9_BIOGL